MMMVMMVMMMMMPSWKCLLSKKCGKCIAVNTAVNIAVYIAVHVAVNIARIRAVELVVAILSIYNCC